MIFSTVVDITAALGSQNAPFNFDLGDLISRIFPVTIILSAIAVFFYLIWGGYDWMTAGEDKTKVAGARSKITNGLIGLTIVASSWAIFRVVDQFFGIGLTGQSSTPAGYFDIDCTGSPCNCGASGSTVLSCNGICRIPSGLNPADGSCV